MVDEKQFRIHTEDIEEESLGGLSGFLLIWSGGVCVFLFLLIRDYCQDWASGDFGGSHLLAGLAMVPFLSVTIVIWDWVLRSKFPKYPEPPGCELLDDGQRATLKLDRASAWKVWMLAIIVTSFFSVFVVAFSTENSPSVGLMLFVWVCNLSLATAATWLIFRRWNSGRFDLVLDRNRRQINLPVDGNRKTVYVVSLDCIKEARHEVAVEVDFDGDWKTHRVSVDIEDTGKLRTESIYLTNCRDAALLAQWLNENWLG